MPRHLGVSHRPALTYFRAAFTSSRLFLLLLLTYLRRYSTLRPWIAQETHEPAQYLANFHSRSPTPHFKSWEEDICHRHGRRE